MNGAREGLAFLSFTERGFALAERLCAALGGAASCTRRKPGLTLAGWTAEMWPEKRALVYVGAAGIAVRAIAPHLRSKATDPAVVAVDELGRFVIPLASGHLGGGNDLAREIAAVCGGTAVITTATDLNGVFAVDEWARRQNCVVARPRAIKRVSGKLLAGETVRVRSAFPIEGTPPPGVVLTDGDGADVWVDIRRRPALWLPPRALVLGVGCRRGTAVETLEARFDRLFQEQDLCPEAVCAAATISLKADEPGLLAFCERRGWPLRAFTAEELRRVPGDFTASAFVEARTGVDNVCERAAVLASGGDLLVPKDAGDGVTFALAQRPVRLDWMWRSDCAGN